MGYLRFIRFPGVFTAFADILAGFFILRFAGLSREQIGHLPQVLMASACFYLAGMAWNDLFDAEEDARLRPERPLPSGEVGVTGGYVTAVALMTVGIMLSMAAGRMAFFVAAALVLCIFLYNAVLKEIPVIGPVCMGCCRGLNLLLGMSAHAVFVWSWQEKAVIVPAAVLTLYVTAVTLLASWENNDEAPFLPKTLEDEPTEVDCGAMVSEPPTDPLEGAFQNNLRRQHDLNITLQQNRLDESSIAVAKKNPEYIPPAAGVRGALTAVGAAALLLPFILPCWLTVIPVAVWGLLCLRPAVKAWRDGQVNDVRGAVGAALAGICVFDAALLTGFLRWEALGGEQIAACAVVAAMTVPVFILRKYIT